MINDEIRTKIQALVISLKQEKISLTQCMSLLHQLESEKVTREELEIEFNTIKTATSDPPPPKQK